MARLELVPLADIHYDEDLNVRQDVTLSSVKDLADDINKNGLIEPIILVPYGDKYRIVCGNRRFMAHVLLKRTHIESIIRETLDEREIWKQNGAENIERKQFTVWEEALWLDKLYPGGLPAYHDVREDVGRSNSWVKLRYRLLGMPKEIQKAVHRGLLTLHELRILQEIPDPDVQLLRFKDVCREKRKKGRSTILQKQYRNNKKKNVREVNKLINILLDADIAGLETMLMAWTQGWVKNEPELIELIRQRAIHYRALNRKLEELAVEVDRLKVLISGDTG